MQIFLKRIRKDLQDRNLIVLANREPVASRRSLNKDNGLGNENGKAAAVRPASGLVSALDPVLREVGGLWIAQGIAQGIPNGMKRGNLSVKPDRPHSMDKMDSTLHLSHLNYSLQRVYLTQTEAEGYYQGFANEALWPLCHIAHHRPRFRVSDWQQYQTVNRLFVQSIPAKLLNGSIVLTQDYHFALAPQFLRERISRQDAAISLFWHIPWPDPGVFGICPWSREILNGMLGAGMIGFHTPDYCKNFLESCARFTGHRVDMSEFSVRVGSRRVLVRSFPIGIDTAQVPALSEREKLQLRGRYGIAGSIVAVGVDRLDYTKGLIERMNAVEKFLEAYPKYVGKFTLIQIASPTRTQIGAYRTLAAELKHAIHRINSRFVTPDTPRGYRAIVFLHQHYDWEEIKYFYQLGDLCMVTSLHDGMNLVAKEYVWCQRSDRGALVLSQFAGASRELTEAIIVNPYSAEEVAEGIAQAVEMSMPERKRRMESMKRKISENSAFRWASDLIHTSLKTG